MCFFPTQQWPCHNNIAADKGLNLFDDCAAGTPGTIANLQTDRALTKINKNGAVVRLRILVELGIL